jgi:photosystem II stability/assembly factor-like uncharacterized protein
MALTIDWTEVFDVTQTIPHDFSAGIYRLDSGSLLAALANTAGFVTSMDFWRSTDNGATWSLLSNLPARQPGRGPRLLKFPGDIVCYPAWSDDNINLQIFRSTNGGASWSLVDTFTGNDPTPRTTNTPQTARTHNIHMGIFGGHFADFPSVVHSQFAVTNDAGSSWTLGPAPFGAANNRICESLAFSPGGIGLAGGTQKQIFRTTDAGASWTSVGPLPDAGQNSNIEIFGAIFLTDDIAIVGGVGNPPTGPPTSAYLYRSTDGGLNWTALARSALSDFPSTGNIPWISELKRLSRDAAILGLQTRANAGASPIRVSLDGGLTYPLTGAGWDLTGKIAEVSGAIAVASNGKILVPVEVTASGRNQTEIWSGQVVC